MWCLAPPARLEAYDFQFHHFAQGTDQVPITPAGSYPTGQIFCFFTERREGVCTRLITMRTRSGLSESTQSTN